MDKKYKAIPTIKQLNLSASPKSISFNSAKSSFSTKSKEDKFNKAYANDFSGSSFGDIDKVRNPLTGRMIDINGSVHKKLMKEGKMSADSVKTDIKHIKKLPPLQKPTSPPVKTENFSNFYEEMINVIENLNKPQTTSIGRKAVKIFLEEVKTAYNKNPSWSHMKKIIVDKYKDWKEDIYNEYRRETPSLSKLTTLLIKYGYYQKDKEIQYVTT